MSATSVLRVVIAGEPKEAIRAADKTGKALGELDKKAKTTSEKLKTASKAVAEGVGIAGAAIVGFAIKTGSELEDSQALLENALKNTHQSTESFGNALDPLLRKMERWGYTNKQTDDSLATLIRAGDKAKTALKDEALAADVAKAKHLDLSAATALLAKVRTGHVSLLGRYGIATKDATGHTISQTQAITLLAQKFGGAAATAAGTFTGKIQAGKAQLTDMAARLGEKLIPILITFGTEIFKVTEWLGKHHAVLYPLVALIGGALVAAIVTATAAWVAETAAMLAGIAPILAVVAAVGAIVAAIVLLWTHWNQVWNWINHHRAYAALIALLVPVVVPIIAIVGAVKLLHDHWAQIWPKVVAIAQAAWGVIGPVVTAIKNVIVDMVRIVNALFQGDWAKAWASFRKLAGDAINAAVQFFVGMPLRLLGVLGKLTAAAASLGAGIVKGILSGLGKAGGAVADFAGEIAKSLRDLINRDVIDKLKNFKFTIGVAGFHHTFQPFGSIPELAAGGIVRATPGGILANLGEGRYDEAVIPLSPSVLGALGNGGDTYINLPAGIDPAAVVRAQRRHDRRNSSR